MDPCEDDMRRKMRLTTNDHGQSFLNTFLKRPNMNTSSTNLEALVNEVVSKSIAGKDDREKLPIGTPISISKIQTNLTNDSDEDTPAKQSLRIANSELGVNIDMLKNLHRFRAESTSQSNPSGGDDFDSDEDFEKDDDDDEESLKKEEEGKFSLDNEKILFSEPCEVVLPSSNSVNPPASGMLEVTSSYIRFTRTQDIYSRGSSLSEITAARGRRPESQVCETLWACQPFPSTQWSTAEIVNVLQRYYQLRFVAIELFTTNRKVFFFNLFQYNVASRFQLVLRKMVRPPMLEPFLGKRPIRIIEKICGPTPGQSLTVAWANREISNFDYLMKLNTIAGRTYNDLGQYPIFPWILSDYTSETLNLRDKAIYRDLRWPIGAQDATQRQTMIAKYYDLASLYDPDDDTSLPPFHYGTHYSVAGFVLWYLMRLEPYTSLHVQLQDGRIDRADRLLDAVEAAWRGCTSNPSDVKELIPEMFYNPEIFVNLNKVDFGKTQGHRKISDIILPPWAKDPHEFVRKHRDALESEYVSKHLHHWIDLVFGCKQRPPHIPGGSQAAVDACNVFFHLTYENAVDLDKLRESNLQLYIQYMCQIAEFGQSPCQLFTKEHIPRAPLSKVDFIWPIASIVRGIHTIYEKEESVGMPRRMLCFKEAKVSLAPILAIIEEDEKLITVDGARIVGIHHWQVNSADAVPPFKFRQDQVAFELSKG
ncbi:hypothetical protein EON65_11810 [archaeon]|nr:MAG: hypothetical protein EON65_11810 [archaeon]